MTLTYTLILNAVLGVALIGVLMLVMSRGAKIAQVRVQRRPSGAWRR